MEWRLLILDGHNSHCTFRFSDFAERHKILVVCLPPHTTHALQPCDVGVFAPLAKRWKSLVTSLGHRAVDINKFNLLHYYAIARSQAFKSSTILSAFAKTGISPLN
ncbi:CENP-B protein, partial [Dendrothele bispora CBS 962.96]